MSDHPTPLGGTCSARFDPLRELFTSKLESGEDLGASLAALALVDRGALDLDANVAAYWPKWSIP